MFIDVVVEDNAADHHADTEETSVVGETGTRLRVAYHVPADAEEKRLAGGDRGLLDDGGQGVGGVVKGQVRMVPNELDTCLGESA